MIPAESRADAGDKDDGDSENDSLAEPKAEVIREIQAYTLYMHI